MEEKGDILLEILKQMSIKNIKILLTKAGKDIELKAKKEVLDDFRRGAFKENVFGDIIYKMAESRFNDFEKRHLSTFPKEKQHNNSSKKDCFNPDCEIVNDKGWNDLCPDDCEYRISSPS